MKKKLLLISLLFICLNTAYAQEKKRCANHEIDSVLCIHNPTRVLNTIAFEKKIQTIIANQNSTKASYEVVRIPVVVHIIHNDPKGIIGGSNNTNISDEQIYTQIAVLNEDYRRKINTMGFNTNPVGADIEIEFFLANKDPNGNISTGITRTYNSQATYNVYTDEEKIANLSYWDSNRYLNIWVCALQGGYLGFAEPPGASSIDGLEATDMPEKIDGAYIDYRAFGKKTGTSAKGLYAFGRTTSHEIGHFFGLIHTWGDVDCGNDYCSDTPPTAALNIGKCTDKYSECNRGIRTRNMIENYMDYSPDSCMNIFTNDQKNRMRVVMDLSKRRRRLINSAKSWNMPASSTLRIDLLPNPAQSLINLQVLLPDFQDFTVDIFDLRGNIFFSQTYIDLPSTILNIYPPDLPSGVYILRVRTATESKLKRIVFVK